MDEIKCPECGAIIQIDETNYEKVASQIRDAEFHRALDEREQLFKDDAEKQVKMAVLNKEKDLNEVISKRDMRIKDLEAEIERMNSEKAMAIKNAVEQKEKEIENLNHRIGTFNLEKDLAVKTAMEAKEKEISEKELALQKAKSDADNERLQFQNKEQSMNENFKALLEAKDQEIAFYKDFKARQSTTSSWPSSRTSPSPTPRTISNGSSTVRVPRPPSPISRTSGKTATPSASTSRTSSPSPRTMPGTAPTTTTARTRRPPR